MIIGLTKELPEWEYRVALTPDIVKQLTTQQHTIYFAPQVGEKAGYSDAQYQQAGAIRLKDSAEIYKKSEILLKIWAPQPSEYRFLHPNLWIVANFESLKYPEKITIWQEHHINALALERLPRLSRVQDIDILSSQNNLSGYKAALIAMNMQNQSVPLMMTAAGTLPPLKAFIIGIGVSGLQAIATLQRMGAQVFGTDIRPETAEQVTSLGARFVIYDEKEISHHLSSTNILITTALSNNGRIPQLISSAQLALMPNGSVAVDIAGGNIEGAKNGFVITLENVKILTRTNLAADVATSASFLYARNMYNLINRWQNLSQDNQIWSHILINHYEKGNK